MLCQLGVAGKNRMQAGFIYFPSLYMCICLLRRLEKMAVSGSTVPEVRASYNKIKAKFEARLAEITSCCG